MPTEGGLWSLKFGGPDIDGIESVIQTTDGGFALAGYYVISYGEQGGWGAVGMPGWRKQMRTDWASGRRPMVASYYSAKRMMLHTR